MTVGGFLLIAFAYVISILLIWKKHARTNFLASGLLRLGILTGFWAVFSALLSLLKVNGITERVYQFLSYTEILFYSIILLNYSTTFLLVKFRNYIYIMLGLIAWALTFLVTIGLINSAEQYKIAEWLISQRILALSITLLGVVVLVLRTIQLTYHAFTSTSQPSHKNRLLYWTLALGIFILAGLFILLNQGLIGGLISLIGYWILVYVVLNGDPKDLIRMGAQSLRITTITLLTVGVYTAGFLIADVILINMRVDKPELTSLLVAAVFVLVFNPAVNWIAQKINNLVFGQGYNTSAIIREYSQSIGNVVDLQLLKQISLGLISKVMGIKNGNLYLVNEINENGEPYYRLSPIRSGDSSDEAVIEGRLAPTSPIAVHFNQIKRPLLQYELDFSSVFKEVKSTDREWLSLQNAEVYVPILTKSAWIGLFVLGPKQSGEKFNEDDLLLLSTLADQTAVALQNAQNFSNLMQVNRELQLAKGDLAEVNQQLREMDELKSSFIRAVTHELRTPLANMAFSLQILNMYNSQKLSDEQAEQLRQVETNLKLTRMMVDNLITFASFLNKQVELKLELVDFKALTRDMVALINKSSDGRGVNINVYFIGDLLPVRADRKLLGDAVYHLIHNAVKFTPEGGKVWVSSWTATDLLYFDVKDTGVGIPKHKLKTLWESFTQMSDSELRGQEGLGLGLALVRFIIAAHSGKAWAESNQGEGSTFGFSIPLAGPNGHDQQARNELLIK